LVVTADVTVPDTTIDTGPSGTVNSSSATFTFSSNEANSTFETRLDNGAWVANGTATSKTYNSLSDASHTFDVRATDAAGNVDQSPASRSWTVQTDSTPPVITPDVSGTLGNNGWYTSNVSVSWTVTDAESAVTSKSASCDTTTIINTDTTGQTVSCTATSAGGTDTKSVTIKRDATAPVINDDGTTQTPNGALWFKAAVVNDFSASDATSGLADSTQASFTKSSGAAEGSAVKINSGSVSDKAGNTNAGIDSAAFKIDLSNPTNVAFVGGPAAGSSHYFGSVPNAPTCTADDAVSGIPANGCVVTGYSTAVGNHTMTATATDNAGRTATATRQYTVDPWTFKGFYQPIDMGTTLNTVKGGSTVPFKFELFAGSTELTDTAKVDQPLRALKVACDTGATLDDIELTATGGTSLRYDTTGGQYIYNWQTPKQPGACYNVTITANDGSFQTAHFKLK
jgi:hypothetical protein